MFLLMHQVRDATRSRFHTGVSMMAVFMVVLSSLLTTTLVSHAPTIFLKLSEREIGQFDGVVYPETGEETQDMHEFQTQGVFVNYTKVEEILSANYSDLHVSPRKQLCGAHLGSKNPKLIRALNQFEKMKGWTSIDGTMHEQFPNRRGTYDLFEDYSE